jgi:hypothetical protein
LIVANEEKGGERGRWKRENEKEGSSREKEERGRKEGGKEGERRKAYPTSCSCPEHHQSGSWTRQKRK